MTEPGRDEGSAASSPPALPSRAFRRWRGIVAAGSVAVAGMLAIAAMQSPVRDESRYAVVEQDAPPTAAAPDPLMAELIRCRTLPPQVDDAACRAAWEENRRRFFGETRAMRVPGDPLPTYAAIPAPMPGR